MKANLAFHMYPTDIHPHKTCTQAFLIAYSITKRQKLKYYQAWWYRPEMAATLEAETKDCKFKACLGYKMSSRPVWTTH